MPDCSETLRHAGRSAVVTRVGSRSRGEEPMAGTDPVEDVRVLGLAADFPEPKYIRSVYCALCNY